MASTGQQQIPTVQISSPPRRTGTNSSLPSLKSPRTARFAEATSVNSPIEPAKTSRNPFADPPTNHYMPQPQPSDVGFGYLSAQQPATEAVEIEETDPQYMVPATPRSPLRSPLKSALKSPGAAPRNFETVMSPTFKEEQMLEKAELHTDKKQRKDLKSKFRVRVAKMFLRGVGFSCSLIVLSMLAATFTIFNATRHLPPRNNLPPWAQQTPIWPQVTLLAIAAVSLLFSIIVIGTWFRHGHKRAEKVAVYYTTFAVAFFIFSIVMWIVGATVLNTSKSNNNGTDIWSWSCKDNTRKQLFDDEVSYSLICRLQNWSLVCCIIEVVIEVFTILIYGIVFYRYYSKRKLRKSMANRDRARSDLYLAQLRSQSAPNTPGLKGPLSPRGGGWQPTPNPAGYKDQYSSAEEGEYEEGVQYAVAQPKTFAQPKPFALQAPPSKTAGSTVAPSPVDSPLQHSATPPNDAPRTPMTPGFAAPPTPAPARQNEHVPAAAGEQQYAPVAIPGGYASPLASPSFAPAQQQQQQTHPGFDFGLNGHR